MTGLLRIAGKPRRIQILVLMNVAGIDGEDIRSITEELVRPVDADIAIVVGCPGKPVGMQMSIHAHEPNRECLSAIVSGIRGSPIRSRSVDTTGGVVDVNFIQ